MGTYLLFFQRKEHTSTETMARLTVTLLVAAMIAISYAQESNDAIKREETKLEERSFYGGYGGYGGYGFYRRPFYGFYPGHRGYGGYYRPSYFGGYGAYGWK